MVISEAPSCSFLVSLSTDRFTPEEFQRLDFSKIDLSEFYEQIKTRATSEAANPPVARKMM